MFGRKKKVEVKSEYLNDGNVVVTFKRGDTFCSVTPRDVGDIWLARAIATGPRPDMQAREIAGTVNQVARKLLGFGDE